MGNTAGNTSATNSARHWPCCSRKAWPFDVAYLIAAHHGRVRLAIRALPRRRPAGGRVDPVSLLAFATADPLPEVDLGKRQKCPATVLDLSPMRMGGEGSWTGRALKLLGGDSGRSSWRTWRRCCGRPTCGRARRRPRMPEIASRRLHAGTADELLEGARAYSAWSPSRPTRTPGCRGPAASLISTASSTIDGLKDFLLERYKPTPIVGPWGARSGFYPGSSESSAREALDAIVRAADADPRLEVFRETIVSIRELLQRHGYAEKVKDQDKLTLMQLCRNNLADERVAVVGRGFRSDGGLAEVSTSSRNRGQ